MQWTFRFIVGLSYAAILSACSLFVVVEKNVYLLVRMVQSCVFLK
jgi:hypothetical protein